MVDLDLNVFPNFYLLSPNSRLFKLFPNFQLPSPNSGRRLGSPISRLFNGFGAITMRLENAN